MFVTYQMKHDPDIVYSTKEVVGRHQNPKFNYKRDHHVDVATESILEYFDKGNVSMKSM